MIVVVAVILILAGILLPILARTVRKARKADCLSQMKNLGTAMALYTDENNSYLPNHNDDNYGSNWVRAIYVMGPYYQDAFEMTICASDDDVVRPPANPSMAFAFTGGSYYWSYVYNMRMAREYPDMAAPSTVTTRDFEEPDSTVTFFEGNEVDGGVENAGADGPIDNPLMEPYVRHSGGATYLMADSHAEFRRPLTLTLEDFTTAAD